MGVGVALATIVLTVLGLQGAKGQHWRLAIIQTDVAVRVLRKRLTATEELEVIDGEMLVQMFDCEAIAVPLAGCEVWLRERTVPIEIRLDTADRMYC